MLKLKKNNHYSIIFSKILRFKFLSINIITEKASSQDHNQDALMFMYIFQIRVISFHRYFYRNINVPLYLYFFLLIYFLPYNHSSAIYLDTLSIVPVDKDLYDRSFQQPGRQQDALINAWQNRQGMFFGSTAVRRQSRNSAWYYHYYQTTGAESRL